MTSCYGFLTSVVFFRLSWGVTGIGIEVLWQFWEPKGLALLSNPAAGGSWEIEIKLHDQIQGCLIFKCVDCMQILR